MALTGWLASLDDAKREQVFAWMRATGEKSLKEMERSRFLLSGGGIPVGAAGFDHFLTGNTVDEYLSALRNGFDPATALTRAKDMGRICVQKHNAQRKRDVCWQRYEASADTGLEHLHRTLLAIL